MRIAVFYTGALRTVEKTIRFFQRNVLLGPHVHVFACVQNDTTKSNEEWEAWFRDKMGPNLVSLVWLGDGCFSPVDSDARAAGDLGCMG